MMFNGPHLEESTMQSSTVLTTHLSVLLKVSSEQTSDPPSRGLRSLWALEGGSAGPSLGLESIYLLFSSHSLHGFLHGLSTSHGQLGIFFFFSENVTAPLGPTTWHQEPVASSVRWPLGQGPAELPSGTPHLSGISGNSPDGGTTGCWHCIPHTREPTYPPRAQHFCREQETEQSSKSLLKIARRCKMTSLVKPHQACPTWGGKSHTEKEPWLSS